MNNVIRIKDIPKREKMANKVLVFLKKYSGSTLADISDALKIDMWCAWQAVATLMGRGEICLEYLEWIGEEVFKITMETEEEGW